MKLDGVESADSKFSMNMDDFAQMVKDARGAKLIASGPCYELTEGEKASTVFRRSLFAVKDIKADEEFTEENVRSIRPGYGLSPKYYSDLLGLKSKRNIEYGQPIENKDLG